jgi:hypothetical protein
MDTHKPTVAGRTPHYGELFKEETHEIISSNLEMGSRVVKRGNFPLTMM